MLFTNGVPSPRVVVSRGLGAGATSGQLDAALLRERDHIGSVETIRIS